MPQRLTADQRILDLVHEESWEQVASVFLSYHPADIADVINHSPDDAHSKLFSLIADDVKPDVLAELESTASADVIESLTNLQLSDIVEEMAPDDAADVIQELPDERSEKVLDLMEAEESEEVRELLKYGDETAGGIMTTDVVAMRENQTVQEAVNAIADLDSHEPFVYAYIVDDHHRLIGHVNVWDLLRERDKTRPLKLLVHKDYVAVSVETDQEDVARVLAKYDLSALPVTETDGKLVGRITADDVIDVLEEEASEDILRLAGSDDAELEDPSALKSCSVRLPWLLITLVGGFLVAYLMHRFLLRIPHIIVLGAFAPIVLAMGGNTGIQASTIVVRSIALGTLTGQSVVRLLTRELLVGLMMGTVCGLTVGAFALVMVSCSVQPPGFAPLHIASIVAVALLSAMAFAAVFGAFVPIILNRFRIDPAVASGPFVTITNDISALTIYFLITALLIGPA